LKVSKQPRLIRGKLKKIKRRAVLIKKGVANNKFLPVYFRKKILKIWFNKHKKHLSSTKTNQNTNMFFKLKKIYNFNYSIRKPLNPNRSLRFFKSY
jgi:hypothetical protein